MKKTILNEIDNMKYLFNYDRSKTINEQQETPVPKPPASGSTVGSGPIPAPAGVGVGGNNSVMPNTSGNEGQATSLMPGNNTGAVTNGNNGENTANTNQQTTAIPSQPGSPAVDQISKSNLSNPPQAQASSASAITPGGSGDPYQYKYEDDGTTQKYYYAKKGQENWKQSTNPKSVEAIKKNIFKIR